MCRILYSTSRRCVLSFPYAVSRGPGDADNQGVLNELRGIQFIDGELMVLAVDRTPDGERTITMPVDDAHAVGCILIELRQLAKEREQELRATGDRLDVQAMRQEFANRLTPRQVLNGSDENVDWATVIRPKPDRWS